MMSSVVVVVAVVVEVLLHFLGDTNGFIIFGKLFVGGKELRVKGQTAGKPQQAGQTNQIHYYIYHTSILSDTHCRHSARQTTKQTAKQTASLPASQSV